MAEQSTTEPWPAEPVDVHDELAVDVSTVPDTSVAMNVDVSTHEDTAGDADVAPVDALALAELERDFGGITGQGVFAYPTGTTDVEQPAGDVSPAMPVCNVPHHDRWAEMEVETDDVFAGGEFFPDFNIDPGTGSDLTQSGARRLHRPEPRQSQSSSVCTF